MPHVVRTPRTMAAPARTGARTSCATVPRARILDDLRRDGRGTWVRRGGDYSPQLHPVWSALPAS
ncbi:hypothetical protein GCM10009566_39530 [Streptomyces murinus]